MWKYAITHYRWDDYVQNIICRDKTTWNPIDLTWCTVKFSIKRYETDTEYVYTWTATITNAVWWVAQINISHTVTENWLPQSCYYDIQYTNSSWKVETVVKDNFIITYDITI